MESKSLIKAAILTFMLAIGFIVYLELYWRGRGFMPTFNDDKVLWSTKRKEIYKPAEEATVFIGGSRIKFDLDVATWEKLTGEKAIQLAIAGTPGRLVLRDVANDEGVLEFPSDALGLEGCLDDALILEARSGALNEVVDVSIATEDGEV